MNVLRESDAVVDSCSRCIAAKKNLDMVPDFVVRLITENLWQHREPEMLPGRVYDFARFEDFCQEGPPVGLGCSLDLLLKLCKGHEAYDLIIEVSTNQPHRPRSADIISSYESDHGTSSSYTRRRLKKERGDLYQQVLDGEMSAHAAAIEAGWRVRAVSVPLDVERASSILAKHFSADDLATMAKRARAEPGVKPKAERPGRATQSRSITSHDWLVMAEEALNRQGSDFSSWLVACETLNEILAEITTKPKKAR